ncbi:GEM-like protein 5 [Selaginella moellendorffii]|nr:GEM-like protein 5 [Selaginella moellendorffii]|eukprot:XP_002966665.2 GEM-like protein 5 [Selaginella moellendorffii]
MATQQQQQQPPSYDQAQSRGGSDPYVSYPQVYPGNGEKAKQSTQWEEAPVMGTPANPSAHPGNQQAAMSQRPELKEGKGFDEPGVAGSYVSPQVGGGGGDPNRAGGGAGSPYVQTASIPSTPGKSPMESILEILNKWGKKAEGMAENVWNHLKAGPSMTDTAWGKLSHGTKVFTEGGYENVFKQTFGTEENERLRKSYACYLSTSTGPVPGVLYISNRRIAFSSDRPLTYYPSPGQQAMSYYKLVMPLDKLRSVNPSTNPQKPMEKYIQLSTVDNHEFWFMGFVNYDKGVKNLQLALNNPNGSWDSSPRPQYNA